MQARVAILLPHLAEFDAVGNDALAMQSILRARGVNVRIFAPTREYDGECYSSKKLPDFIRNPEDVIIYHYTVYWDKAYEYLRDLPGRKIVKYHNVTPAHFFAPYHAGYAEVCARGREQIAEFSQLPIELLLGDSQYNVREWIDLGFPAQRTAVLPPFHRVEQLFDCEADLNLLSEFSPDAGGIVANMLMVGRLVPNKGYHHLLEVISEYRKHFNRNCRLILAGKQDPSLAAYNQELKQKIRVLGLQDAVVFTGTLTEAALKALYLSAHVLVLASEHEGFCVPAIEAMSLKVPVVAWNQAAVGETIGGAGLVWDNFDPLVFAGSVDRLLNDADLLYNLVRMGREQYENRFHPSCLERDFLNHLSAFLPGLAGHQNEQIADLAAAGPESQTFSDSTAAVQNGQSTIDSTGAPDNAPD
ncbi:MAG: glycosyltransferase family 4 protein [Leptospiraceae bacterium]|nr:glycosyltransferase family 4 protein [Leptospiraceae bacterium]